MIQAPGSITARQCWFLPCPGELQIPSRLPLPCTFPAPPSPGSCQQSGSEGKQGCTYPERKILITE